MPFVMMLGPEDTSAAQPGPHARDGVGVIVDGTRVLTRGGVMRASHEGPAVPLVSADRVPRFLGGGLLFRNRTELYASETFDGALQPIASFPVEITSISFGPKGALVRGADGERWALDLPSGARANLAPPAVVDIAALGDGRAIAFTESGGAFVSTDKGAHWIDVSHELTSRPATVFANDDALWLTESGGPALRLDAGGKVAKFDAAPPSKASDPPAKDPRWRIDEPPIKRAIERGAPIDDATAVVVVEGDILRVNVATGEIVSATPGRLPPEASCEAVRVPGDVLFVCTNAYDSFVVSHVLDEKSPVIEQSFTGVGPFTASDDGGLAFGGPCARPTPSLLAVCVRAASGGWREYDLESASVDAGADAAALLATLRLNIVRWIPRADGNAIGVVTGATPGTVDARTGEVRAWASDTLQNPAWAALVDGRRRDPAHIVDRDWAVAPSGALRGWTKAGVGVEIGGDGVAAVSPFTFDRVKTAGPLGFAQSKGGRSWQTVDHGASWVEVLAPPAGRAPGNIDPRACSAVGCDLGAWYRLGWTPAPAEARSPATVVKSPPRIARAALAQLTCKPAGDARTTAFSRGDRSPEDLGLGAMRLPLNDNDTFVRTVFDRKLTNPPHNATSSSDGTDYYTGVRAVFHGYAAGTNDNDHLVAFGPDKNVMALRRQVAFIAPFDPVATIRKTSFGVSDMVASARARGMQTSDVLSQDPTAVTGLTPVMPLDPSAASDLAFFTSLGGVGVIRAPATPDGKPPTTRGTPDASRPTVKVGVRAPRDDVEPVSAVATGPDDVAILEIDTSGSGRVIKLGASGVTDLFDVPGPPSAALYPANTDALAIGPRGDVALLRTPSGADPPSTFDPALILVPGAAPVVLAPWSTLTSADDEACRADTGGWRATVQSVGPWIRVTGGEPSPDADSPMLARVRWSATRVCLEAVELRIADTPITSDAALETWVVARFVGSAGAGRVAIVPGTELRQPMQCTLGPR